jgi:hypothetical protein
MQALAEARRIGTTFHETFPLKRSALSQIVELCNGTSQVRERDVYELLRASNQARAMPQYARGCGLLKVGSFQPTVFGRVARERNPSLDKLETLWLMHYHLSAPHGPGPAFWSHLVTARLQLGDTLEIRTVATWIGQYLAGQQRPLASETLTSAASSFLRSYVLPDGLQRLGLLEPVGSSAQARGARVVEPEATAASVVGYCLADYWEANWGSRPTVSLDELSTFGAVFLLGPAMLASCLTELQSRGVLELHRVAPPYQVFRLWGSKEDLLDAIY